MKEIRSWAVLAFLLCSVCAPGSTAISRDIDTLAGGDGLSGTLSGNPPLNETATSCTTNGVANVGNSCAAVWGGGDIGARINAAIATLPDGGTVYVPAGLYSFTTTIVVPRYITLMGS